jgi:micrococcal nuclease
MTMYEYRGELVRVVDGDTYDFEVDLGFHVFTRIRVRMLGVDTAETYGVKKESEEYQNGIEQKRFVEDWFDVSDEIFIETEKDEQGKYGRWLARVYNESGESLNVALIEEFGVGTGE